MKLALSGSAKRSEPVPICPPFAREIVAEQYKNRAHSCVDRRDIPRGQYLEHRGRLLATTVRMFVFDCPESGQQSLGGTMPKHRHPLKRMLYLLLSRGLACLFGSRISQIRGDHLLRLGVFRLCGFPEIHT